MTRKDVIVTVGPLAHPALAAALDLRGESVTLKGRLQGGARAGIDPEGWPVLVQGVGSVAGLRCEWTPALKRYAAILGLHVQDTTQGRLLGLGQPPQKGPDWDAADWSAGLAAGIARRITALDHGIAPERVRDRLGQIAGWVASQQRAAAPPRRVVPRGPARSEWEQIARDEPYAAYFSVERLRLRHRLYAGGWSEPIERAVFVSGDASVLLPWDPRSDHVLLIEQFRAGPAARGDPEPWLCETIAGRIDAGETPESAARREAWEEAGIRVSQVFRGPDHYPSPGAVCEMLYLFIGISDLSGHVAGIAGVESEAEDIRSRVVSRSALMAMIDAGELRYGPLLVLALWLERQAENLRMALAGGGGAPSS